MLDVKFYEKNVKRNVKGIEIKASEM